MTKELRNIPIQDKITVNHTAADFSSDCGNAKRVLLLLKNVSTGGQTIWINWEMDAVESSGTELAPNTVYAESEDAAFKPLGFRISAIASADGALMTRHERRE
jgi:hypothetical protein